MMFRRFFLYAFLFLVGFCSLADELRLARVFADHGVLQGGRAIPVWGQARPGAEVTVEFSGAVVVGKADDEGAWKVEIPGQKITGKPESLFVRSGAESIERKGLLIGEVWYASGQSNMQMTLASCARKLDFAAEVIADPESRMIRTMRVDEADAIEPRSEPVGELHWQVDTPANRPGQSAVAYFFAREIHDRLQVPVGIIEGAWGGKPIEGFIPRGEFKDHLILTRILSLADGEDFETLSKSEGGVIIRNTAGRPGRIFNARVSPIAPYAIAGFLWYQGESNAGKGEDPRFYREKMEALVRGWRNTWEKPELPFYFVQLPSFKDSASGWIRLREEQRLSLGIKNTGMAVAIDLRDEDIHPSNKVDVGRRLAAWALRKEYGEKVPFSGPLFRSAKRDKGGFRVMFDHAESGLMTARKTGILPVEEDSSEEVGSFELADEAGKWHPASAVIEDTEVLVVSESVANPIGVRYACEGDAENANLYNRDGFPASPFCSDLSLLQWIEKP